MVKEISKNILLTGAGFTKNFGGLLATEMWSKIFNHNKVQSMLRLRNLLMDDFDYESIYYKVINGSYETDERDAMSNAIFQAYKILDDIVRNWFADSNPQYPIDIDGVNKMIENFAGNQNQLGFFFSLNQDLFIERHFNTITKSISYPGIKRIPDDLKLKLRKPIDKTDYAILPSKEEVKNNFPTQFYKNTLHYIKLHGSYGWISSDGSNKLVIGKNKEDQIAYEPLLSNYFKLFKRVLITKERRLLIIGYGFRDQHINEVIADAILQSNLKYYVLSPKDQSSFIRDLKNVERGDDLLKGLSGYFPYTLLDTFPSNGSESHAWKEIKESFFIN